MNATTILRYLTKQKLEWLLSDKGIYMGAASHQSDPDEGRFNHKLIGDALRNHPNQALPEEVMEGFDDLSGSLMEHSREVSFISSWYLGENETYEMWDEYAPDGVVLASNTLLLTNCMPSPLIHAVDFYGTVYNNVEKENSPISPLRYKNEKYSKENEFRIVFDAKRYSQLTGYDKETFGEVYIGDKPSYEAIEFISCMSEDSRGKAFSVIEKKSRGYIMKYDLNALISEVRVNPDCTTAEAEGLRSMFAAAGLEFPVNRSKLPPRCN